AGIGGMGNNFFAPDVTRSPQRFQELKLSVSGKVATGLLPPEAKIVRLRVDGRDIPMMLDPEVYTGDVEFGSQAYARQLYDSILTRPIDVIGDEFMLTRIKQAADAEKPLPVSGYVWNPDAPYIVEKSIGTPH